MGDTPYDRWCRYYWYTELFDRSVCSAVSPITGLAMPVGDWQRSECTRNALEELRRQRLVGVKEGMDQACRLSMEELEREVRRSDLIDGETSKSGKNKMGKP